MDITNQLPKRTAIEDTYKWNLNDMIASTEEWQKLYDECLTLSTEMNQFKGTLGNSSQLLMCLTTRDTLLMKLELLYVYSHMQLHEDTNVSTAQEMSQKATALESKISQSLSYIEPEIIMHSDALNSFIKEQPELKTYQHYFNNLIRKSAHILSKEQEELLSKANDFASSIDNIFSMFNEADIKFPTIKDENGETIEITKGRYISLLESSDRRVRKEAFEGLLSTYKKSKNTLAATYTSNIKKHIFYKDARNFSSSLEAALFENNIEPSVYNQLIDTVHQYLPAMHKYVNLRKKVLNLDDLHMYDLYTPIIKDIAVKIPYEEAVETVKKALSVLGDEYVSLLEHAFNNRWIDVFENEGKRSGAYSWGAYTSHPYVLLNYNNSITNMFTLAHEMGHALHSYYSDKNQPYIDAQYKIFLAEVASTVNEALLMEYLRNNTDDKNMKLYLLNHFMEKFRGTVFRQTMFAEYEKMTHDLLEKGEALTADRLCELYYDLNVKYYGPHITHDQLIEIEWARIPHFYYDFYVFQYATGFSSAIALSKSILTEGAPAINRYLEFLKGGNSDYPINLLKKAGVDMTTPKPISSALDVFVDIVNEMERTLL